MAGQPDVLYTYSSGAARAAAAATSTIPIVIAPVAEETMAALVPDFAHPPGNITGLTLTSREQREKCLQLLKEAVPGISRVEVLFNPLNPAWRGYPEVMDDTARALGIELVRVEAHGVDDVDQTFAAAVAQGEDMAGVKDRAERLQRLQQELEGTLFNITHEGSERIIAEHQRRLTEIEALRVKDGSNAQQVDQLIAQSAAVRDAQLSSCGPRRSRPPRRSGRPTSASSPASMRSARP